MYAKGIHISRLGKHHPRRAIWPDFPDVIVIAANGPRDDRLRGRRRQVTSAETQAPQAAAEVRKFPLTTPIAMVVGSMAGAGSSW